MSLFYRQQPARQEACVTPSASAFLFRGIHTKVLKCGNCPCQADFAVSACANPAGWYRQ
eukprot:m.468245 g.468245  ORF g.468245 m.468245 type:complete len:59 (-) comp27318_c0_seq1:6-182(-)